MRSDDFPGSLRRPDFLNTRVLISWKLGYLFEEAMPPKLGGVLDIT